MPALATYQVTCPKIVWQRPTTGRYVEQDGAVGFFQTFAVPGVPHTGGDVDIRVGFFHALAASYARIAYFDHLQIKDADGTVLWSDSFEYADLAAALAAGWTLVDTLGAASDVSISTAEVTEGMKALRIAVTGATGAGQSCYLTRTVTALPPGEAVTFSADVYENEEALGTTGIACGIEFDSAGGSEAIDVGFPLARARAWSPPSPGSDRVIYPSGASATWLDESDALLEGTVIAIPAEDDVTPMAPATGWNGPSGWRAFLEWAWAGNVFDFWRDRTDAGSAIACQLVAPREPPAPGPMGSRQITLRLRSTTLARFSGY